MAEHWITVKEAAECCNCKENTIVQRTVRNQLQYKYVDGKGRNGKQLRILLESLSDEAQCRYAEKRRKPVSRDISEQLLDGLPQDKLDELNEKLLIVQEYIRFRDSYPHKDHVKQFVRYMKKNYPMFEFKPERLSKRAVRYEQYGAGGLIDLRGHRMILSITLDTIMKKFEI